MAMAFMYIFYFLYALMVVAIIYSLFIFFRDLYRSLRGVNKISVFLFMSAFILPVLVTSLGMLAIAIDEIMGVDMGNGVFAGLGSIIFISIIISLILIFFGFCINGLNFLFKKIIKNIRR